MTQNRKDKRVVLYWRYVGPVETFNRSWSPFRRYAKQETAEIARDDFARKFNCHFKEIHFEFSLTPGE